MDSIKYIQVTYPYPPLVQIIRWSYVYFYLISLFYMADSKLIHIHRRAIVPSHSFLTYSINNIVNIDSLIVQDSSLEMSPFWAHQKNF